VFARKQHQHQHQQQYRDHGALFRCRRCRGHISSGLPDATGDKLGSPTETQHSRHTKESQQQPHD
jgi:hypothetical protein